MGKKKMDERWVKKQIAGPKTHRKTIMNIARSKEEAVVKRVRARITAGCPQNPSPPPHTIKKNP